MEIRHPLTFSSKKIEKIPSGSSTFKLFLSDKADDCINDQNCELQCTAFSVTKNFDRKIRLGCRLSNMPYNANIFLPIETKNLIIYFL